MREHFPLRLKNKTTEPSKFCYSVFINVKTKSMQKSALGGVKILWPRALLKTLFVMKLAIILVLVTAFGVHAIPLSGQNVSLSVNHTEIKKVLKTIEREGNFRFLFNSDLRDLKRKVDFTATNIPVSDVLNSLFAGTNLTFKQLNNNLIVVKSTDEDENRSIRVTGKVTGENGAPLAPQSAEICGEYF